MNIEIQQEQSFMMKLRESSTFGRAIGSIVIISIVGLSVVPAVAAAQQQVAQLETRSETGEISPEAEMSQTLLSVVAELKSVKAKLTAAENANSQEIVDTSAEDRVLDTLTNKLDELDDEVMAGFDDVGVMLEEKDLPDVIVERHERAVDQYRGKLTAVMKDLEMIRISSDRKDRLRRTTDLAGRLQEMKHKRSQQHFDPAELPSRSLRPDPESKPKITAMDFAEAFPLGDYRNLMANVNGSSPTGDDAFNNPDWLSESDEVELTQAIVDKAAELGNNPVAIYHWVRNNVQWNPNWGAKQTAQLTMELRSGNAIDIASLTIALMRASGIPARYVHGTIDVPESQFRNWAGGFQDIDSATGYAANGGIPVGSVVSGGRIVKVRMEHVWVEVAVDFVPSRAAVNIESDSWIAIDPSYKQFEYLEGLDPIALSGVNVDQLAQDFVSSGIVSEAESWAMGLDATALELTRNQVQSSVDDYVDNNVPNSTVGDVVGGQSVIIEEFPTLGASLPNDVVIAIASYASVPNELQQRMTFALDVGVLGELLNPESFSWARLNNKKITLGFSPATPADEAALVSLFPDGPIDDVSQYPDVVPAYLVNVIPELRIGESVVMTGDTLSLGDEIDFRFNVNLAGGQTAPNRYVVVAGSYLNVAAIGNGVSGAVLDAVQNNLDAVSGVLTGGDKAAIGDLSREEILGEVYYACVLGYYEQYMALSFLLGKRLGAYHALQAGVGTIGYEPRVQLLFGVPVRIETGGVVENLPFVQAVAVDRPSGTGSAEPISAANFNVLSGLTASALEHAVLEQVFQTDTGPQEAFSTVKALEKANALGQRIYQLTPANMNTTLPALNLDAETEQEISAALSSGKTVLTHTNPVSVEGFSGAGYVIVDPVTGDGAYRISGGANGGFVDQAASGSKVGAFMFSLFSRIAALGGERIPVPGLARVFGHAGNFASILIRCAGDPAAIISTTLLYGTIQLISRLMLSLTLVFGPLALLIMFLASQLISTLLLDWALSVNGCLVRLIPRHRDRTVYA